MPLLSHFWGAIQAASQYFGSHSSYLFPLDTEPAFMSSSQDIEFHLMGHKLDVNGFTDRPIYRQMRDAVSRGSTTQCSPLDMVGACFANFLVRPRVHWHRARGEGFFSGVSSRATWNSLWCADIYWFLNYYYYYLQHYYYYVSEAMIPVVDR